MTNNKNTYMSQAFCVWLFQICFTVFILMDSALSEEEGVALRFDVIPDVKIGFIRFISGMIMHVMINNEIKNGLLLMKYAVNHPWKFKYHRAAVITGFMQFSAVFLIALANYMVITISDTVIDIAKDFTALIIIADFDNIFTIPDGIANDIIEGSGDIYESMFIVETTTSNDAVKPTMNSLLQYDKTYEMMKKT